MYSRQEKKKKKDNRRRAVNSPAWPDNNQQELELHGMVRKKTNSQLSRRNEFNKRPTNNNDRARVDHFADAKDSLRFENQISHRKVTIKNDIDREKISNNNSRKSI